MVRGKNKTAQNNTFFFFFFCYTYFQPPKTYPLLPRPPISFTMATLRSTCIILGLACLAPFAATAAPGETVREWSEERVE